jgi:hypothetical protein
MKILTGRELLKKQLIKMESLAKYLHSTLFGRVLSEDIKKDKKTIEFADGRKLSKGTYIDAEALDVISKSGVESVNVLTPFNSLRS